MGDYTQAFPGFSGNYAFAADIETEFDSIVTAFDALEAKTDASLRAANASSMVSTTMPIASSRASKILTFDDAGTFAPFPRAETDAFLNFSHYLPQLMLRTSATLVNFTATAVVPWGASDSNISEGFFEHSTSSSPEEFTLYQGKYLVMFGAQITTDGVTDADLVLERNDSPYAAITTVSLDSAGALTGPVYFMEALDQAIDVPASNKETYRFRIVYNSGSPSIDLVRAGLYIIKLGS